MGGSIACHVCDRDMVDWQLKRFPGEASQVNLTLDGPSGLTDCGFSGNVCGHPDLSLRVFHCPGHTAGTIALVSQNFLIHDLHLMIIGSWYLLPNLIQPEDDPNGPSENPAQAIDQANRMLVCFGSNTDTSNVFLSHPRLTELP
jgi:glyoxylase-like metal-dependent hydrolase (beta-lactamase superfamily II)